MAIFEKHPSARWLAPLTVLAVAGGGSAVVSSAQAGGDLPAKSAQQLLTDVQQAKVQAYSGTVSAKVDLGLGSLSGLQKRTTAFQNMADGSSTVRVWADGPDKQRVALVGEAGEADVVRNGRSVWTWNAEERTAEHSTLPAEQARAERPGTKAGSPAAEMPKTPQEAAQLVLSRLDPTTKVTTNGLAQVAGRDAYELVLAPKAAGTLVRSVAIDVDAKTSMPLRVVVRSTASDQPAVDIGFTSLDLTAPAASTFDFTPPAGATVTEQKDAPAHAKGTKGAHHDAQAAKPVEVGTGWSTVTVGRVPAQALASMTKPQATKDAKGSANPAQMLAALPKQSGAWGTGRVFEGTLFSVAVTDDGRYAVGAVPSSALLQALASTHLAK